MSAKFQWIVIAGTVLGGVLASWLGPKMISWYFSPPIDIAISCRPAIDWALERLRTVQLIGMGVGFAASLVLYFTMLNKKSSTGGDLTV